MTRCFEGNGIHLEITEQDKVDLENVVDFISISYYSSDCAAADPSKQIKATKFSETRGTIGLYSDECLPGLEKLAGAATENHAASLVKRNSRCCGCLFPIISNICLPRSQSIWMILAEIFWMTCSPGHRTCLRIAASPVKMK